jgi:ComEC/Rec2-related protein
MLIGIAVNGILNIHIDAWYLIAISFVMLFITYHYSAGKFLSAIFLGMCIQAESESTKTFSMHGRAIRMKAIVNGILLEVSQRQHHAQCVLEGYIDTPQFQRIEHCRVFIHIYDSKIILKEGMHVQVRGIASNPMSSSLKEEFDQAHYVESKNVQFLLMGKDISIISHDTTFHSLVSSFRELIKHTLAILFPHTTNPIVQGILLGETSQISPELRSAFASLGTAHILSVSGFHAGIIAVMLQFMLSWIRWLFIRNLLLTVSLLAFLELVHWDPPAVRACMMTSLAYALRTLQRKPHPLHVLLTIGGFMICFDPSMLSSLGFQMSMIGMFGLILFPQYFHRLHASIFPESIAHALSQSISAILALLPMTAWYFGMISLIAPIANMIFIPIFTIALCWSIIALFCFPLSSYLGNLFAISAHQCLCITEELHLIIARWDWITYTGEYAAWISCTIILSVIMVYRSRSIIQFLTTSIISSILLIGIHDIQVVMSDTSDQLIQYHQRNDVIVGISGENILFLDRDRGRFTWNDRALIHYVHQYHKKATIMYSGKSSKKIALSIQQLNSMIRLIECEKSSMRLCMNIIKQSSASTK